MVCSVDSSLRLLRIHKIIVKQKRTNRNKIKLLAVIRNRLRCTPACSITIVSFGTGDITVLLPLTLIVLMWRIG